MFTVGHGTRSTEELALVLAAHGVGHLVDIRRHPGSRRQPHLSREPLAAALPDLGISYAWWGEELGGRRRGHAQSRHPAWRNASFRAYADYMDTEPFRTSVRRLLDHASATPLAVMCAETLWWNCHRRLVADAAVMLGVDVVHLMNERDSQVHPLHPGARRDEDGWPVYDAGVLDL